MSKPYGVDETVLTEHAPISYVLGHFIESVADSLSRGLIPTQGASIDFETWNVRV